MIEIPEIVSNKAVLVALVTPRQTAEQTDEYLDELAFLCETAGIETRGVFTQKMERPDTRTFVGQGKLAEIKAYMEENEIQTVVFDDDLSPSQLRNIEKELKARIYDRSLLILDIFQSRAQTAQARTQVELARSQYLLPRLTRMWTHLERQRGGTGTRGGAGEKEIETDRRVLRDRIARLKRELQQIDRQMHTQRGNRGQLVRVALVGYTNVGKSTLMNLLSKSEVFAENKLFATLDTTVRKVVIDNLPFLLTDTVGFIRKLPHQLVESFKSTLDEVREADLLVHVVDISHPRFMEQYETVNKTLAEIDSGNKPTVVVFNKIDQYHPSPEDRPDWLVTEGEQKTWSLEELRRMWLANMNSEEVVFISAIKKQNIDELKTVLYGRVREIHQERFPYNNFLY